MPDWRRLTQRSAAEMPVGNRVRMIRALEIFHTTGRPKSELKRTGAYPTNNFEFQGFLANP